MRDGDPCDGRGCGRPLLRTQLPEITVDRSQSMYGTLVPVRESGARCTHGSSRHREAAAAAQPDPSPQHRSRACSVVTDSVANRHSDTQREIRRSAVPRLGDLVLQPGSRLPALRRARRAADHPGSRRQPRRHYETDHQRQRRLRARRRPFRADRPAGDKSDRTLIRGPAALPMDRNR